MSPVPLQRILPWLLALFWAGLVLWASLDAAPFRAASRLLSWDKLQHALAYGVLAGLSGWALATRLTRPAQIWGGALLLCVFYGGVLEVAQGLLTRHRRGEFGDLVADLVGAGSVTLVAWLISTRRSSLRRGSE